MTHTPAPKFVLPTDLGEKTPLGYACKYCGSANTWIELRLVEKPRGSYSIAGFATKVVANAWPHAVCGGCGHVSVGKHDENSLPDG